MRPTKQEPYIVTITGPGFLTQFLATEARADSVRLACLEWEEEKIKADKERKRRIAAAEERIKALDAQQSQETGIPVGEEAKP